ncbi:MAG: hypothetical protein QJR08_10240 [Bacillota bacterium]|nr:hypothetical protein [Bacillota bacterium]
MTLLVARRPDVCAACGDPIRAGERIDWDARRHVARHAGCAGAAGGRAGSGSSSAVAGAAPQREAAAAPAEKAPATTRPFHPLPPEAPTVVHLRGVPPERAPAIGSKVRGPKTGEMLRVAYVIPVWWAADGEWILCVGARPAGGDPRTDGS